MQSELRTKNLNALNLKLIAITAMLIDHIAWRFVPSASAAGIVMHFIGRITGPVMFYLAVEGYHHTRNFRRYMLRLGIFAVISQFPFALYNAGGSFAMVNLLRRNVIFTILLGLFAINIRRTVKNPVFRWLLIGICFILAINSDWGITAILMMLSFDFFYGNFKNQAFAYSLVVLCYEGVLQLFLSPFNTFFYGKGFYVDIENIKVNFFKVGMFLPLILLYFYNGEKGSSSRFSKWIFYIFYPLHMLVIAMIEQISNNRFLM